MSEDAKSSESDYESSLEEDEFSDVSEEVESESDKRKSNKRGSAKKIS